MDSLMGLLMGLAFEKVMGIPCQGEFTYGLTYGLTYMLTYGLTYGLGFLEGDGEIHVR